MANAGIAGERLGGQLFFESVQLAFGAAAGHRAMVERGDAGRVIAAIFEALQRVDQLARDRRIPENSNDSAHPLG
jgi:hypothetical protein